MPIVYKDIIQVVNEYSHPTTSRLLTPGSRLPSFARACVLDDRGKNGSDDAEPLTQFVTTARNLRKITIYGSYQISQKLLDAISVYNPTSRIEYHAEFPRKEYEWHEGGEPGGPLSGGMPGFSSPQLHTLYIDRTWAVDDRGKAVVTRSLEKMVKNCPNLRALKFYGPNLELTSRRMFQEIPLDLRVTDQLPQLEEYSYVPLSLNALWVWGAVTGWATLRVLKLGRPNHLPAFAYCIPTLRHFTISLRRPAGFEALESFQGLIAPLEEIYLKQIYKPRIPRQFLERYKATIREISIHPVKHVKEGFSNTEMRILRSSCPQLKRLCVYYPNYTVVSEDIITEICQIAELRELILDRGSHPDIAPKPSIEQFLALYERLRQMNINSNLTTLALNFANEFVGLYGESWEDMLSHVKLLCKRTQSGDLRITQPASVQSDFEIYQRNKEASYWLGLVTRPFLGEYPAAAMPGDLFWAAKQLGPGPGWAENELLPEGLMTREQLDSDWSLHFHLISLAIEEGGTELERHRKMVKEELRYLKKRKELLGNHGSLYDMLYPNRNDSFG